MSTPTVPDVDSMLRELEKLPLADQRTAFFARLEGLPLRSVARHQLADLGRRVLPACSGPFGEKEFRVLAGVEQPQREYSPEEVAAYADHAAALAVLVERRQQVGVATERLAQARRRVDSLSLLGDGMNDAQRAKAIDAEAVAAAVLDEVSVGFEDAAENEVRLRPFNLSSPSRRGQAKMAAGRNWLRRLQGGAGR